MMGKQWRHSLIRGVEVTTLFVTHDQEEALTMSDRIVVMRAGQIEQVGTPGEIYDAPSTPFVARFIGWCSLLNGTVDEDGIFTSTSGCVQKARGGQGLAQPS